MRSSEFERFDRQVQRRADELVRKGVAAPYDAIDIARRQEMAARQRRAVRRAFEQAKEAEG